MRKLDYNLVLRKLLEKFTNSIHIKDEISKQEKVQKILKNRSLIIEIGVKGCGRRVKTIYFSSQTNKLQLLKDLFQIDYNKDLEKTLSFYRANNSLTNFCFNFSTC
ncbi:MAG: hypothetical protein N2505_05775 [Endomicrobia bacterium]|nr:hypothetical protein [Endomicrobiia bacterium]